MYDLVGGFNHLKNISQWEGLSHILWKIKNVGNHQPVIYLVYDDDDDDDDDTTEALLG